MHNQKQPCAICRANQKIGPQRKSHTVVAVVAIGKNRELGEGDRLLWHIPDDLKRFKRLTLGHPIVMGRKTFESIVKILGKPLPERTNIVVTRDSNWKYEGILAASSIEDAIELAKQQPGSEEIHIGGGAQIYEQALPFIDKLYLTLIDDTKDADAFFPPYEHLFTKKTFEEARESNGLKYRWVDLCRKL
ncbi:dihydrofolate reductase [Candidatus Kaiserbacteria bacterium]|nr:dihydrofolate reductase [Candidatus Kaiserbacteria bacterium]